jgi:methylmalonyl-CoA mutase N-terminal domain/subunit
MGVERGDTVIVGVNKFSDGKEPPLIPAPDFSALEKDQVSRLTAVKAQRDAVKLKQALDALAEMSKAYAKPGETREQLMPLIVDAVRVRASVGEIADALREQWGVYRPS